MSFYSLWSGSRGSAAAPHTRSFPEISRAPGAGVSCFHLMFIMFVMVVCMTAYYAGQCSACGLLCWLGWVYLGVGWPGHTYWHMCSSYVNVDITGQMEVSKHHL